MHHGGDSTSSQNSIPGLLFKHKMCWPANGAQHTLPRLNGPWRSTHGKAAHEPLPSASFVSESGSRRECPCLHFGCNWNCIHNNNDTTLFPNVWEFSPEPTLDDQTPCQNENGIQYFESSGASLAMPQASQGNIWPAQRMWQKWTIANLIAYNCGKSIHSSSCLPPMTARPAEPCAGKIHTWKCKQLPVPWKGKERYQGVDDLLGPVSFKIGVPCARFFTNLWKIILGRRALQCSFCLNHERLFHPMSLSVHHSETCYERARRTRTFVGERWQSKTFLGMIWWSASSWRISRGAERKYCGS